MKPAALFGGLKSLLQLHSRSREEARVWLLHRELRKLAPESARGFEFGRTVLAPGDVLFQFMTGVIRQFVINVEDNVLLYPFALHSFIFCGRDARSSTIPISSHFRQRSSQFLRSAEQRVFGG